MLDTHGRKYISPLISFVGDTMIRLKLSPNNITMIAFFTGISTGVLSYLDFRVLAVLCLWLSGLLDAVDGYVARTKNRSTSFGTLLDISSDRVVELLIVLGLSIKFPDSRLSLIFLVCSIVMSMTIFLTVGALSDKESNKSFYYQAGVMERTEGFIFFTLMIFFTNHINIIASVFAALVSFTAVQRFIEGKKLLD